MNNNKKNYEFIDAYKKGESDIAVINSIIDTLSKDKGQVNSNVPKLVRMDKRATKLAENMFSSNLKYDLSFENRKKLHDLCLIAGNTCYVSYLEESKTEPVITAFINGKSDKEIASELYKEFKKAYGDNKQNKEISKQQLYNLVSSKIDSIRNDNLNPTINKLTGGYAYNNQVRYFTTEDVNRLRNIVNHCAKVTKLEYSAVLYANGFIKYYMSGKKRNAELALLDFFYQNNEVNHVHMDSTKTHLLNILKDLKEYRLIDDATHNNLKNMVSTTYKLTQDSLDNTEEYRNIVVDLVESDYRSLKDYANSNNIEMSKLYNALGYIKYADKDLYARYREKMDLERKKRYASITTNLQTMARDIKYGVKNEDGTVRKFDTLDYFNYTKMSPNEVRAFLKSNNFLSKDEYVALVSFLGKNAYNFKDQRKTVEAEKLTINGHTITDEERKYIIDYLDRNHIPCSIKMYGDAVRRYLNGELDIEKVKSK